MGSRLLLRRRWAVGPVMALVVSTLSFASTPAGGQASDGTIVYVKDELIWIATPDGDRRHQVTTEGRWFDPSMSDDGVITAIVATPGQEDRIVRLTQSGEVLSAFTPDIVFDLGLHKAEVRHDDALTIYGTIGGSLSQIETGAYIVDASGEPPTSQGGVGLEDAFAWYPGTDIVVSSEYDTIRYFAPGDDASREWIDRFDLDPHDMDISRDGELLGIVGCDFGTDDPVCERMEFHGLSGPPPAATTRVDCTIPAEDGGRFQSLTFGPDGASVVYDYLPPNGISSDVEIVVVRDLDLDACAMRDAHVLEVGAREPFWSPATFDPDGSGPVDPGPGPGGGGSTPPQPDAPVIELVDGGRIDGGGETDPVGQTVTTSQEVWDDDGAALVVLATADRFPDALAGAALAGEQGPILVTPFGDTLDPRVATEIQRVLPDDGTGTVAILGGTNAVSATAGQQALDAAGITSCPAPFPTDCRYAGTGREHTATLVAATVLALNDGSGNRALLARGDAFADAITGGAYAAEAGVPILLTPSTTLAPVTQQFITDNGIAEAIVLGGTSAISDPVAAAVPTTTRRIAGNERTATAAAIATDLWHTEGLDGGGILAINVRHDNGWQTALAAAVVSALANAPQLGVEGPPTPPGQPVLDAAALLGGPVATLATPTLVSNDQLDTLRTAASSR